MIPKIPNPQPHKAYIGFQTPRILEFFSGPSSRDPLAEAYGVSFQGVRVLLGFGV